MKTKLLILSVAFFSTFFNSNAQILDKLLKKVESKVEQKLIDKTETSTEKALDSLLPSDKRASEANGNADYNTAKSVNTTIKRRFFNQDVIMHTYDETNQLIHSQFFDFDEIAMRTEPKKSSDAPLFHDSEGFVYAYNKYEKVYEKTKLLSLGSMSLMGPSMAMQFYKLPAEPFLNAFEMLSENNIKFNFLILEFAFIYKPEHFEADSYYKLEKSNCKGSSNCKKFIYNDSDYPGSYVEFDDKNRLSEMYINATNPPMGVESSSGRFVFEYKPCEVNIPKSIEKKMPLQDLFEMGMEPEKHNEKKKNR